MRRIDQITISVVLMTALGLQAARAADLKVATKPERSHSLEREAKAGRMRALKYLQTSQLPDGSWSKHPAITGLVIMAMVGSGEKEYGPLSEPVQSGLAFIRKHVQEDGGIYQRFYANYTTSVCLMALHAAGQKEDRKIMRDARAYLLKLQADGQEDFDREDPQYGGFGYELSRKGGMRKPDLSNLQWSIEALKVTEEMEQADKPGGAAQAGQSTKLAFDKALVFLARCQNLKAVNDQKWAENDGGFVYSPYESKAGEEEDGGLRSYGGMTYAGLKSMIYADVDRNDRRVIAAYNWIRRNWTVKENPNMGLQGLFYYYQTMAKALDAYGREVIIDDKGKQHDWRTELTKHLLSVQKADGYWQNTNARWMESIPDLVTAYVVIALNQTLEDW